MGGNCGKQNRYKPKLPKSESEESEEDSKSTHSSSNKPSGTKDGQSSKRSSRNAGPSNTRPKTPTKATGLKQTKVGNDEYYRKLKCKNEKPSSPSKSNGLSTKPSNAKSTAKSDLSKMYINGKWKSVTCVQNIILVNCLLICS